MYGLAQAEARGWTSAATLGLTALGLALIAVFAKVETTVSQPLLPMRVMADRTRGGAYAAVGIV